MKVNGGDAPLTRDQQQSIAVLPGLQVGGRSSLEEIGMISPYGNKVIETTFIVFHAPNL